jgi:hypothetical protein
MRRALHHLRLRGSDRALLAWMTWLWPNLLSLAQVVQPETILRWQGGMRCSPRAPDQKLNCDQSYTWDGVPADLNFVQFLATKTRDPAPAERRAGVRSTIFSARRWTRAHGAWP